MHAAPPAARAGQKAALPLGDAAMHLAGLSVAITLRHPSWRRASDSSVLLLWAGL